MCLAVPTRVIAMVDDRMAMVELGGVKRQVALDLVPDAQVGDYVIVHVGFAIQRLAEDEAQVTLAMLDEVAAATQDPPV